MQHDASEGHRLLYEAYERDGSLGPLQTLSAFAQSHRQAWGALRDRLPVQLGDVSQQVSSVFAAIDEEVDPLLPGTPAKEGTGRHRGASSDAPGSSSGTDRPAPSASSGSTAGSHSSTGNPKPSSSSSTGEGLLGGTTGGLLDPPKDATSSSPSAGKSSPTSGAPNVTLPPLLPGLLPGLGIDSEDNR
jgi:hypothetical protein